jgi:hypothetical protein
MTTFFLIDDGDNGANLGATDVETGDHAFFGHGEVVGGGEGSSSDMRCRRIRRKDHSVESEKESLQ